MVSTRAVSSRGDASLRQPLNLVGGLARTRTSVDRRRCARSLEEEVGVDPVVSTTKAECFQVVNGGGSGGEAPRRLDNHALGEIGGSERQPSMLGQIGGILGAAVNDSRRDSTGSWAKFGLSAPKA